jgi:hypothetical protein
MTACRASFWRFDKILRVILSENRFPLFGITR